MSAADNEPSADDRLRVNVQRVRDQVAQALVDAGRANDSITVVAVSKYVTAELAWRLALAGWFDLGESRPQSLWQKHEQFAEWSSQTPLPQPVRWHMIGHLQRNKIARTVPMIEWLHSLDSLRLAEALHAEMSKRGQRLKVLIEVNPTQDTSKTGVALKEALPLLERLQDMPHLDVRGLMAMSTDGASPQVARREFETVRQLRDQLQQRLGSQCRLSELSMGMSGDFAAAIAAGATMVRVGSLFWEGIGQ